MMPAADAGQDGPLQLILLDSHGRPHLILEPPPPEPAPDGSRHDDD